MAVLVVEHNIKIVPAIVAVGYNRADSLERLLQSIAEARYDRDDIPLVISLDYCKDQQDVIRVAEAFDWQHGEKIVRTHETNLGLRRHILSCGDLAQTYGGVIILEDDIVVSPAFYHYAIEAMNHYDGDSHIAGTALYSHAFNGYARERFTPLRNGYDVYFGQFSVTWGQAWTASQWQQFRSWYGQQPDSLPDREDVPAMINVWGKNSWGKYFVHYLVDQDLSYVMPYDAVTTCYADAGENIKNATMDHQTILASAGPSEYRFPDYADGVHYDLFFENRDLEPAIREQYNLQEMDRILVDLYGLRTGSWETDYVLTPRQLSHPVVGSYGRLMRPLEMNVLLRAQGQEFYLYQVPGGQLQLSGEKRQPSYAHLNYDAEGMPWQNAVRYGVRRGYYGAIETLRYYLHCLTHH